MCETFLTLPPEKYTSIHLNSKKICNALVFRRAEMASWYWYLRIYQRFLWVSTWVLGFWWTKREGRNHVFLSDFGFLWTILDFLLVRRGDPIARFNRLKSEIKYKRRLVNTVSNTVDKFLWLVCWSYWGNKFSLCVCQWELRYNKFSMLLPKNSMMGTWRIGSVLI